MIPEQSIPTEETLGYSTQDKDEMAYGMVAENSTPYGEQGKKN